MAKIELSQADVDKRFADIINHDDFADVTEQYNFDQELLGAGLINVSDDLREWIMNNPTARQEVARLNSEGFGEKVNSSTTAQAELIKTFEDAAAQDNLRSAGIARDIEAPRTSAPALVAPRITTPAEVAPTAAAEPVVLGSSVASIDAYRAYKSGSKKGKKKLHLKSPRSKKASPESTASARGPETEGRHLFLRVVGGIALAGVLLTGGAKAVEHFTGPSSQEQTTSVDINLASKAVTLEQQQNFFNNIDPSDLLEKKTHINNFGPPSEALRNGDHQGVLKDWHDLFTGKNNGAEIMTTYLAALEMGDAPKKPSAEQMKDPKVYWDYMDARIAYAKKLTDNPDLRTQLYNDLMDKLGHHAEYGPIQSMQGAADYVNKNVDPSSKYYNHVLTDLSIAVTEDYVPVTVDMGNGVTKVLLVKIDCDCQLGEENLHPLATPTPEQPAPVVVERAAPAAPILQPRQVAPTPITEIPTWNTPDVPTGGGGGWTPETPTQDEAKDYSGGVSTAPGIDPSQNGFIEWTPDPVEHGNGTASPNLIPNVPAAAEIIDQLASGAQQNTHTQVEHQETGAGTSRTDADQAAQKRAERAAAQQQAANEKAARKAEQMSSQNAVKEAKKAAQSKIGSDGRPK